MLIGGSLIPSFSVGNSNEQSTQRAFVIDQKCGPKACSLTVVLGLVAPIVTSGPSFRLSIGRLVMSGFGLNRTSRAGLMMPVVRGGSEVVGQSAKLIDPNPDIGCSTYCDSKVARGAYQVLTGVVRIYDASLKAGPAMQRREFLGLVCGAATWPAVAQAQQTKRLPVVGVLWAYPNAEVAGGSRRGLLKGFAELGYNPGRTFVLEERYAGYDSPERFDTIAVELAALKVDVVVSQGGGPATVLHRKDPTIPVVAIGIGDPMAQGLATSLSKPGGNVTGVTQMGPETAGKRLQLLKEVSLAAPHVALLRDPTNAGAATELSQYPAAAKKLGLSYNVFDASTGIEIDQAFQRMADQHSQAAVVFNAAFLHSERKRISDLGLRHRLALMGPSNTFVDAGSLMSYGPDYPALWQSSAHFVDKILKGERVGDIPIQQPTKFNFCINLKTARVLGSEIPPAMLALADQVIE